MVTERLKSFTHARNGKSENHAAIIPFAVINHHLEPNEVAQWIEELAETGIDGAYLHPRLGLMTPYFSQAWFEVIDACIQAARRAGIQIWLYDEFPYPSGTAGGQVLAEMPEAIEASLAIERIPYTEKCDLALGYTEDARIIEAYLVKKVNGNVKKTQRITDHIGTINNEWIRTRWDSRFYYNIQDTELFECPRSDSIKPTYLLSGNFGSDWDEIVIFREKLGSDFYEPCGNYVDVSSAAGTKKFLQLTHERYFQKFGSDFGSLIRGVFTDEPKYRNLLPWSKTISSEWEEYRNDPLTLLALAEDIPNAKQILQSYRNVCGDRFQSNWCKIISEWCESHKLQFCGHISPEEDWFLESALCGSILACLRHFHVPGCDLIIPAVGDRKNSLLNFIPVMAASAASQMGRPQALCELFGASDYSITAQDMKRIADWLMLFGINVFVPHALFYSIDGERKYDAPPTFFRPNALWNIFPFWCDHIHNIGNDLGPMGIVVNTAIVRPMQWLAQLRCDEVIQSRTLHELAMKTCESLLRRGLMFHFVDDTDLANANVEAGEVIIGAARYQRVIDFGPPYTCHIQEANSRLKAEGVEVINLDQVDFIPHKLKCTSGEIRATETHEGRVFLCNLSQEPESCFWDGRPHNLAGYESRWIDQQVIDLSSNNAQVLENWTITPTTRNIILLQNWHIDGLPGQLGPIYRTHPSIAGETILSALGPMPKNSILSSTLDVRYQTRFCLKAESLLDLIIEPDAIKGKWQVKIDGKKISHFKRKEIYDRFNQSASLGVVSAGWHILEFEITTDKSTDGLLDNVRLMGDFAINEWQAGYPILSKLASSIDPNDWKSSGFPHFSGCMRYEAEWKTPTSEFSTVWISFDRALPAHAIVSVNGKRVGCLAWAPWQLDITNFLIHGNNTIQLEVASSLTNLIYGRGKPSGFDGAKLSVHYLECK